MSPRRLARDERGFALLAVILVIVVPQVFLDSTRLYVEDLWGSVFR